MSRKSVTRIYSRSRNILESARTNVARTVNTTLVVSNWLIGLEIVEAEQEGKRRAEYGEALLSTLAAQLHADGFTGYSLPNLKFIRQFYLVYPELLDASAIGYAVRSQLQDGQSAKTKTIIRSRTGCANWLRSA
jgi:hypothetical protein